MNARDPNVPPGLARRKFFSNAARYGILAGLAAVTARVSQNPLADQKCINAGICRDCDRVEDCGLPAALSLRSARQGGNE